MTVKQLVTLLVSSANGCEQISGALNVYRSALIKITRTIHISILLNKLEELTPSSIIKNRSIAQRQNISFVYFFILFIQIYLVCFLKLL